MNTAARKPAIRLAAQDNVVIARVALEAGTALAAEGLATREALAAGDKIAACAIRAGAPIIKHGAVVAVAARDIAAGEFVGSRNVTIAEFVDERAAVATARSVEVLPPEQRATFQGFVRADGRVGTRNYIVVLITVNCAATAARKIAEAFDEQRLAAYPNVDGVVPLVHEIGCGMEMTGEPMDLLRRTLAGTIRNPNTAAAVVCSLGCERNNIYRLFELEHLVVGDRLKMLVMQETGGTQKTIDAGIAAIEQMLPIVNNIRRQPVSSEHLVVGLQGGPVDAFTGISADPGLGAAVDLLVRNGGTAIVSETSEVAAIERRLTGRAASSQVGAKLVQRIEWWKAYNKDRDTPLNQRSVQQKGAAGVATLREKAVGSSTRWGSSPLMEVYRYAEPVTAKGLVFMDTPGYEAVSATGQIAGGANLICMTTGRASSFSSLPAPTIKLASTTALFKRMDDDMDVDCGPVIDGELTVEQMGQTIFAQMLRHAGGEKTKGEELGVGTNEFVPWPIGVVS